MYSSSDWRKALTKLLELTSQGEVKWNISGYSVGDAHRQLVGSFEAQYAQKLFVVSEFNYKHYFDEDEWYWAKSYELVVYGVIDAEYRRVATAPDMAILPSLYSAAEDSFAFSKDALGGLLD